MINRNLFIGLKGFVTSSHKDLDTISREFPHLFADLIKLMYITIHPGVLKILVYEKNKFSNQKSAYPWYSYLF